MEIRPDKENLTAWEKPIRGRPKGVFMELHSDQSDEAKQGAWNADQNRCFFCHEEHGWWQGVVASVNDTPHFMCVVCTTIRGFVPPPEGYIRLHVSEKLLEAWRVKERGARYTPNQTTIVLHDAMPLRLAWMMEQGILNEDELTTRHVVVSHEDSRTEKNYWPMLLRRPVWFQTQYSHFLDVLNYAESYEDQTIHQVLRSVLEIQDDEEWSRTVYTEFPNVFCTQQVLNYWQAPLPESHKMHSLYPNAGYRFVEILPWKSMISREQVPVLNRTVDRAVHGLPVVEAMEAVIRSRHLPTNSPLWKTVGLG